MSNASIAQVVQEGGVYVGPTVGISMRPMLKEGRDTIVVTKKEGRLKVHDVALYLREGRNILHRVIAVTDEGYIIRGDNCYADEVVPEGAVIGVLTQYFKGKKEISLTSKKYVRYVKRRLKSYPVRRVFYWLLIKIKRIIKAR